MRIIKSEKIRNTVADLCQQANFILRPDVLSGLKKALAVETNKRSREILSAIIKNAQVARAESLAICQDTGLVSVFLEVGQDVKITGDLKSAVNQGIADGYRKGCLRNSVVKDPILRGKSGFVPGVIHTDIVKGSKIKISLLPKGFGCENKTQLRMFRPTATCEEINDFIIETVKSAGPDACPPFVVGVGIGGNADYACLLAKKALFKKVKSQKSKVKNQESEILKKINQLNIGPMGLGGKITALGVNIEKYPTHIAGLPVCVSISCHALRSAAKTI